MKTNSIKKAVTGILLLIIAIGSVVFGFVKKINDSSPNMMIFIAIIAAILGLVGLINIIMAARLAAIAKYLEQNGKFTKGRILYTREGRSGSKKFYYAKISYKDSGGFERTFEDCNDKHRLSREGEIVDVRFAQKKNGKYIAYVV